MVGLYGLTFDRFLGAEYRSRAKSLNCKQWHLTESQLKDVYGLTDISWAREEYHRHYVDCLDDAGRTEHWHRVAAFTACSTILTLFVYFRFQRDRGRIKE